MAIHLLALGSDKVALDLLPEHSDLLMQFQFCDTGVLTFKYPKNATNAGYLARNELYLQPVIDGEPLDEFFVLDDDSDDLSTTESTSVTARGIMAITERAAVYPGAHTAGQPIAGMDATAEYTNATPGAIFADLFARARARGVQGFDAITTAFTSTHDSAGTAWPASYSTTYTAGVNYLELLRNASDNGWIEMRMKGWELQLFVPGTELALTRPDVILYTGKSVRSGPRQRSRRGIITHMLGVGAEKNITEASDATATASYGRREGSASDGRMTESGSLLAMTQAALAQHTQAKEGYTASLTSEPDDPKPNREFWCGEYIYWDAYRRSETELEPLRVRSISFGQSGVDSEPQVELELNDVFVEQTIRLERQMQGITQGAVTTNPTPDTENYQDTTVPERPAYVNLDPVVYPSGNGHRVSVTVSWPTVPTNTDGSAYVDHASYAVQISYDGGATWSGSASQSDTALTIGEVMPGAQFAARVAAVDRSGNQSAWRLSQVTLMPDDDVAPPTPSAPLLTTRLGTVTVAWNGMGSAGESMPTDFERIDVECDSVIVGAIRASGGAGALVQSDLAYGEVVAFRFRAVDRVGNQSEWSQASAIAPSALVDTDLIGEVVSGSHLIDGTLVASEKMVAESITAGLLAANSVSAGNIAANAITADKIAAGTITAEKLSFGVLSSNLVRNPTFEDTGEANPTPGYKAQAIPGWTISKMVTTGAQIGAFAWKYDGETYSGNGKAILNADATVGTGNYLLSSKFPVVAGTSYTTAFVSWAWGALTNASMSINFYTAADVYISGAYTFTGTIGVTAASSPTRVTGASTVAPAGAAYARVQVFNSGVTGTVTQLRIDSVAVFPADSAMTEITAAGVRLRDTNGYRTELTTRGLTVFNGSEQALVRVGHGVTTGLEIRHPTSGVMMPLATHVFGSAAVVSTAYGTATLGAAGSVPGHGAFIDDFRASGATTGWSSASAGTDMRITHVSTTGRLFVLLTFACSSPSTARSVAARIKLTGASTLYSTEPEYATASDLTAGSTISASFAFANLVVGGTYTVTPQYASAQMSAMDFNIWNRSMLALPC